MSTNDQNVIEYIFQVQDNLSAKLDQLSATFQKYSQTVIQQNNQINASIKQNVSQFGTLVGVPVTIFGIVAAMKAFTQSTLNFGQEIKNMSLQMGISIKQFQELRYAGIATNTDMGTLRVAFMQLSRHLESVREGSIKSERMFKSLGVSIEGVKDGSVDAGVVFNQIRETFAQMPAGISKTSLAVDLFGRFGNKLQGILNLTNKEFENLIKNGKEAGVILGEDQIKKLEELGTKYDLLKEKVSGFFREASVNAAEFWGIIENSNKTQDYTFLQKLYKNMPIAAALRGGFDLGPNTDKMSKEEQKTYFDNKLYSAKQMANTFLSEKSNVAEGINYWKLRQSVMSAGLEWKGVGGGKPGEHANVQDYIKQVDEIINYENKRRIEEGKKTAEELANNLKNVIDDISVSAKNMWSELSITMANRMSDAFGNSLNKIGGRDGKFRQIFRGMFQGISDDLYKKIVGEDVTSSLSNLIYKPGVPGKSSSSIFGFDTSSWSDNSLFGQSETGKTLGNISSSVGIAAMIGQSQQGGRKGVQGGAAGGAMAGAQFGPYGMLIGAAIGAGAGLFGARKQRKKKAKLDRARESEKARIWKETEKEIEMTKGALRKGLMLPGAIEQTSVGGRTGIAIFQ